MEFDEMDFDQALKGLETDSQNTWGCDPDFNELDQENDYDDYQ
tara:strand:+ start:642 stop:770 length:129 start_codon:yes stop_codon:yes gene_type:complete